MACSVVSGKGARRDRWDHQSLRSNRSHSLSAFVDRVIAPAAQRRGLAAATLIADWTMVVGEHLARRCQPVRLTFAPGRKSGGTLLLHAAASAALDLQFSERQVVERINAHYGYAAVARLRIVQSPPARPMPRKRRVVLPTPDAAELDRIHERTDRVDDPVLAAALERLGCSVVAHAGAKR